MFKLIGENSVLEPVKTVLVNRGVPEEDIAWFQNPTEFEYEPELIKNMDEGAKLYIEHMKKGSKTHIQIDKDLDGKTSFALTYLFTKKLFPNANITWSNHGADKKHGIDLKLIPEETEFLIVPDAGSGEYDLHKILKDKGIDVLVLDHHEADKYSEDALVVNVHLDDYPNKQLSGVGVCMKFAKYVDKLMGTKHHEEFYDLVAFGLVGDAMKMTSKETFWMVQRGLANIKNEFLVELVKENASLKGLKIMDLSFKCNPKINSLIRVGTKDELNDLSLALIGHQEITINNRLKSANKEETWARRMTRTCNNTYARQRRIRDKVWNDIEAEVEEDAHKNKFITVHLEDEFDLNMSGYLASFIVGKYNKPTLVVRKNEELLTGSMRGYDPFMSDTKEFLNSLEVFEMAEGHGQAAGIKITEKNFAVLNDTINFALQDVEVDSRIEVDFSLDSKLISPALAKSMIEVSHLWGRGIDEPKFAVTDISIVANELQSVGKTGNVVKYFSNGVEYVCFSAPDYIKDLIDKDSPNYNPNIKIITDIVGRLGLNEWQGRKSYQFVIEHFDFKEEQEAGMLDFLF